MGSLRSVLGEKLPTTKKGKEKTSLSNTRPSKRLVRMTALLLFVVYGAEILNKR